MGRGGNEGTSCHEAYVWDWGGQRAMSGWDRPAKDRSFIDHLMRLVQSQEVIILTTYRAWVTWFPSNGVNGVKAGSWCY